MTPPPLDVITQEYFIRIYICISLCYTNFALRIFFAHTISLCICTSAVQFWCSSWFTIWAGPEFRGFYRFLGLRLVSSAQFARSNHSLTLKVFLFGFSARGWWDASAAFRFGTKRTSTHGRYIGCLFLTVLSFPKFRFLLFLIGLIRSGLYSDLGFCLVITYK